MNKKLIVVSLALILGLAGLTQAAPGVRGAKGMKTTSFTATAQLVCAGGGAVYSVLSSTAAVGDYVVLRDSGTANTSSALSYQFSPSATLTSQLTFDPPLQFYKGISINQPATNNWSTVTYECGRITYGQ
jgi:hypothetical protein